MTLPAMPRVADVMATSLPTVSRGVPAFEVAARMERDRLRHVLVVQDDALQGLVDRAALLRYLVVHVGTGAPGLPIEAFMIARPVTIGPDAPASDAIAAMRRHRIGSLPVVDGDALVGLVSERRLMLLVEALVAAAASSPR